jgi:hypothetical protein
MVQAMKILEPADHLLVTKQQCKIHMSVIWCRYGPDHLFSLANSAPKFAPKNPRALNYRESLRRG